MLCDIKIKNHKGKNMKLATTTEDFSRFYIDDDKSRIVELANAGFKYIDLSLFHRERINIWKMTGKKKFVN